MSETDPLALYTATVSALQQLVTAYNAALAQIPLQADATDLYPRSPAHAARLTALRAVHTAVVAGDLPYGSEDVIRAFHAFLNAIEDMERRYGNG